MDNAEARGPSDAELSRAIPPAAGTNEFRVGVFVLLGLVGFMTVLFLMTDPSTFRGRYLVVTHVENAAGIRRGDPVQMKGVNIGRVHRFGIRDEGVDITLEIEGEWEIPLDSRTRLSPSGLLGGVTVEVLRGTSSEMVREGGILPGESGSGLMSTVEDLGGKAEGVLGRLEMLLDNPTVSAMQSSAQQLNSLLVDLSDLTRTQGQEISRLTANLSETADGLSGLGPEAEAALGEARATLERLNETSDALGRAATSLDTILARMAAGEGSLGRMSTDDELYTRLSDAAESAQRLLDDIRQNPRRYIRISVF